MLRGIKPVCRFSILQIRQTRNASVNTILFNQHFAPTDREKELLTSGEPLDLICGGENLQSVLPSSYDGDWAVYPFLGEDKILAGDLTGGLFTLDVRNSTSQLKNRVSDFDGDGKTDYSVYTPSNGLWQIETSSNSSQSSINFGVTGDKLVTGDYDGDGKSDQAIFRPSTGTWWIRRSSDPANFQAIQFGLSSDIPVAADYDADGKTDIAVFRPSNGVWYILQSTLGIENYSMGNERRSCRSPEILKATAKQIWRFFVLRHRSGMF